MRIVVVLPAPLDAAEAEHRPGRDGEADAVEHAVVAEALVQPVELEHVSSPSVGSCTAPYRPSRLAAGARRLRCHRGHERGERAGAAARRRGPGRAARGGGRLPGVRAVGAGDADGVRRGPGDRADRLRRRAARRPGGPEGRAVRRPGRAAARPGARRRRHRPPRRLRHQRGQALPVHGRRASGGSTRRPGPSTCAPAGRGWRRSSPSSSPRSSSASARRRPRR